MYNVVNELPNTLNTVKKLISSAIEESLPPKFCWKTISAEKTCKEPNFEYHFLSCKLKCAEGYERYGFHCRKACPF